MTRPSTFACSPSSPLALVEPVPVMLDRPVDQDARRFIDFIQWAAHGEQHLPQH